MARKFNIKLAVLTRLVSMSVITVFAILLMIAVHLKGRKIEQSDSANEDALPALVSVSQLQPKSVKIKKKYSGTIRPFERYMLSFKSAGRVNKLGVNQRGTELDEGDWVTQGMELAWLDTSLLEAQKEELQAALDFAFKEYDEVRQQKDIVSESEFRRRESEWKIAGAKLKTIETQIDDGVLRSKVAGVISRRMVKPGESVGMGQTVFEVIQVDQVKLVVGIPESKIGKIIGESNGEPLKAYVRLIGENRLAPVSVVPGEKGSGEINVGKDAVEQKKALSKRISIQEQLSEELPPRSDRQQKMEPNGTVYRVSQTSDEMSGLFEVEILLGNEQGQYRPGMIAIADIVVDEIQGYPVPIDAAFFRDGATFVFVQSEENPLPGSEDQEAQTQDNSNKKWAKKLILDEYGFEIQGDMIVVKQLPEKDRKVIVGGHRRLVNGREIKPVESRAATE